jgi:hypothetical protein
MRTVPLAQCVVYALLYCVSHTSTAQQATYPTQATVVAKIEGLLESDDPRQIAWGAHYAYTVKDTALTPDLLAVANHWQALPEQSRDDPYRTDLTPEQLDRRDAMAAILDALIHRDAPVPADTLRKLAPGFPNEAAVLLSRLPAAASQSLSFEIFLDPPPRGYSLQYVSTALLANSPPPGFAAHLLSSIEITAELFVVLPDSPGVGYGSAGCCGLTLKQAPREDWPAFGTYAINKHPGADSSLLLSVIDPIYANRSESTHYQSFGCGDFTLTPEDRRRFIAHMLQIQPEAVAWKTSISHTITYHSPQQFDFDLRSFITEQQDQYRSTAQALAEHHLMTDSDAGQSLPVLALRLHDMRGEGGAALAEPSPLPPRVTLARSSF